MRVAWCTECGGEAGEGVVAVVVEVVAAAAVELLLPLHAAHLCMKIIYASSIHNTYICLNRGVSYFQGEIHWD